MPLRSAATYEDFVPHSGKILDFQVGATNIIRVRLLLLQLEACSRNTGCADNNQRARCMRVA